MSPKRVIWSIFFTSSVTAAVYRTIVEEFVALFEVSECRAWFQQDNAKPHVVKDTMDFLYEFFEDRIYPWPARNPDLSPLDIFL